MALTTILLELNWILNQRKRNVERNWILSTKTTKPTENKVFSKASSYYVSKKILQSHFFLKKSALCLIMLIMLCTIKLTQMLNKVEFIIKQFNWKRNVFVPRRITINQTAALLHLILAKNRLCILALIRFSQEIGKNEPPRFLFFLTKNT